jgi:hypothetical protein
MITPEDCNRYLERHPWVIQGIWLKKINMDPKQFPESKKYHVDYDKISDLTVRHMIIK